MLHSTHGLIRAILRFGVAMGLLAAGAAAHAQAVPTLSFVGPANYTPGTAGNVYTLVVGNTGDAAASLLPVTTNFPTTSTTVSFACAAVGAGSSCGTGGASGTVNVNRSVSVAAGGSVTFTITVTYASSLTTNPLVVTAIAGALSQPVSSDLEPVSDVSVVKSSTALAYVPGTSVNGAYTVVVANAGPSDVTGVSLADNAPAGMTIQSWSCAGSGGASCPAAASAGPGNVAVSGIALPSGGSLTYTLNVSYAASASADPLNNTATISVPASANDPDTDDHSSTYGKARKPETDLAVAFTPNHPEANPGAYVPGSEYDDFPGNALTLTASNLGPTNSAGATLTMVFPLEVAAARWQCSPLAACTPNASPEGGSTGEVSVTLAAAHFTAGSNVTIAIELDYASSAITPTIEIEASIAPLAASGDTDPVSGNDSAVNFYDIDRRADISVVKTSGLETVNPGSAFVYSITVTNAGPSDVGHADDENGILLTDLFPSALRGDPDPLNCGVESTAVCWRACPSDGPLPAADEDGPITVTPDACPEGVEVVDGSGNISALPIALRKGNSTTILAYVSVGGTATGQIANTASIALDAEGVTEINPGVGNSSTDTVTVELGTDIAISKVGITAEAVPGLPYTYEVEVTNTGFITANNVAVQDVLPLFAAAGDAGFIPGSISWQCRAFDGACCNHNSSVCGVNSPTAPVAANVLNSAVDLPGQGRVRYTITGTLHPRATGTLENTASAVAPAGIIDSNQDNNEATAEAELAPKGNLSISKSLVELVDLYADAEPPQPGPPFKLTYRIVVANSGPSRVAGALVTDDLSDPNLDADHPDFEAEWSCAATTNPGHTACAQSAGTGELSVSVDLDPGGVVTIELQVASTDAATGTVSNTAEVNSDAGSAAVTIGSGLSGRATLEISKTDNRDTAVPGSETDYVINVRNLGPDDVFGARVTDIFPPELQNVSWTCEAATPVPGDLAFRSTVGQSQRGGRALAVSADGRHIYVAGSDQPSLFVFSRDNVPGATFGAVAPLETETHGVNDPQDPGGTVTGMQRPIDVVLSPDGLMVYVLSYPEPGDGNPAIAAFSRIVDPANPNFGRISFAGSITAGVPAEPRRMVASQTHIYVSGDSVISIFRRDVVSGVPVHQSEHGSGLPVDPGPMAVSLGQNRLFVASSTSGSVARFAINPAAGAAQGELSAEGAALVRAELEGADDLALVAASGHLYVRAPGAGRLALLNSDGAALGFVTSYTAADINGSSPLSGAGRIAVSPDGEHLIAVSVDSDALLNYGRDTVGGGLELQESAAGPIAEGLTGPADVAISSDGRHVLIAAFDSGDDELRPLTIYSRRAPDPLFAFLERDRQGDDGGNLQGLLAPVDVAASRDGRHVYAISLPDNALTLFQRNSTLGLTDDTAGQHLEFVTRYSDGQGGVSGIEAPSRVLISPDGRSVFVTSQDGDSLAVFERDAVSGELAFLQVLRDGQGGVTALLGAHGLAMDPGNSHLYVAASFESAIGIFRRDPDTLLLNFIGEVRGGVGGVTGLAGIRDLVVSRDGAQVLGVGSEANTVVVFNRSSVSTTAGQLSFLQSLPLIGGNRPISISIPGANDNTDVDHVYVVAQNSNSLHVLRRQLDPTSAGVGSVQNLFRYNHGSNGIDKMRGPRAVRVSPNGKRVYVASQIDHSVLAFDRDTNRSSANFGGLTLAEVRSDNVDGVDGINNVYSMAVSNDSRHVYAAGFGDSAVASFAVGTGSTCSAGGGGNIDDFVDIGARGTLVYRANATIRPDAVGILTNLASVELPDRFSDPNTGQTLWSDHDDTELTPLGDLSITKTNSQVSVVAGETVTYEVVVRNAGPSNLVHTAANPLTVTDILPSPPFVVGSATWTCAASGSGALGFVDVFSDTQPGVDGLGGVSGLLLIPDTGVLPARYLAAASVLDNSVTLFQRDPVDGRLLQTLRLAQGGTLNGVPLTALEGARALAASADGRFLYVGSRTSDAINVFEMSNDAGGLMVELVEVISGFIGLDQVLHLAISPDGRFLYAAGANDNAIAGFARDLDNGTLSWIESEQNGVNDPNDPGGTVAGLGNVEFIAISPDGAHLYALSASGGSIARFDRDIATGLLTWRNVRTGTDLNVAMDGVSSAVFDASGEYLYLTAAVSNRVVVLRRVNQAGGTFGTLSLASSVAQGVGGTQGLLAPRRAALSGDGQHLYVTAQAGAAVSWFSRDPLDGSLRFLGLRSNEGSDVDGLLGATGIVIDNDLNQVYVAGTLQGAVVQFERGVDSFCPPSGSGDLVAVEVNVAAGGSLTFRIEVQVAPGATGTASNTAIVTSANDPNQSNNQSSDSDVITVTADLGITKDDGLAEYDGLAGARAITGDALNLYVAGADDNAIGVFARRDDAGHPDHGSLRFQQVVRSAVGGVTGLGDVADLAISTDGAHLYAVSPTENSISTFVRQFPSGRLGYVETDQNGVLGVTGMAGARALAQSPDGRHVYVAGAFSNAIAIFGRNADPLSADYGRLAFQGMVQNGVGSVEALEAPIDLVVSPDGLHVYALGNVSDSVVVFLRNPNAGSGGFGQLQYVTSYRDGVSGFFGLNGARSLAISSDGTDLYVLGAEEGALVHFTRDAGNGHLTQIATYRDGQAGVSGLTAALRIRLSPDEAHLYVASATQAAIGHFLRDSETGSLAFAAVIANGDPAPITGGQVLGLDGVSDMLVSPDGDNLYSVSRLDNALGVFDRAHGVEPEDHTGELDYREAFFDGLGGVAPGDAVTYLIAVENFGPSNVPQARVVDVFPAEFESVTWTCTGSGGGLCPAAGVGNIDTIVNLPVGARVTFAATGVVSSLAGGRLVNTASVNGINAVDPNPGNNSATDDDTVLSPAMDLVVAFVDSEPTAIPGAVVDYTISIDNLGPSYAASARVSDLVPAAVHSVSWTCHAEPVAGILALIQDVPEPLDLVTGVAPSALGQFVYATGSRGAAGAIAVYQRDPISGVLSERQVLENSVGGVSGIAGARHLVLSSDERFVYVAGEDSDAIAVFARNASNGELSFLARYVDNEFGVDGIGGVRRLLLGPGGNRLYAAGSKDDAIAVFAVSASTGLLTPSSVIRQGDAGVDGLNGVSDIAWTADGLHLLAVAVDNQSLSAFARNTSSGALSFVATVQNFQLPGNPLLGAVDVLVGGERIFVAARDGDMVSEFRFSASPSPTFTLEQVIADDIGGVPGLLAPEALLFEPDQARLYVAGADRLHLIGLLTDVPQPLALYAASEFAGLESVAALASSPNGRQLYVGGSGTTVFARERGSRCPLQGTRELSTQTVDIAPGGFLTFLVSGTIYANATGLLEYLVRIDPLIADQEINPADNVAIDIRELTPAPDLAIFKVADRDEVVAGLEINWLIEVDNAGVSDALAANVTDLPPVFPDIDPGVWAGDVEWTCAANLPLDTLAGYGVGDFPELAGVGAMALSPDGARLYAVNPGLNALLVFPRAIDGSLAAPAVIANGSMLGATAVSGLMGASFVAVTPDGRHVLVTGAASNSLVVFSYDASTGNHGFVQRLTSGQNGVNGLQQATSIAMSRDGGAIYVASRGVAPVPPAIAVFRRNPDTGLLAYVERVADGLGTILPDSNVLFGIRRLHVTEDGRHLYAVADASDAVSAFSVNTQSGTLTYLGALKRGASGLPVLDGARALLATPGDQQIYVLGDNGIGLFERQGDGRLQHLQTWDAIPDMQQPRSILMRPDGSRLYLADGAGAVHVFARDWSNGDLDLRYRLDAAVPGMAGELLYAPDRTDLYVASAQPGALAQLDELALSRCLTDPRSGPGIDEEIDLGVGGWAELGFGATVHPSARGVLENTAFIMPGSGTDPDLDNNQSTASTPIIVVSDIAIEKTAPEEAVAGTEITFDIRVTNLGPSTALGIRVVDTLHPALSNAYWTCVASEDSSCPESGTGNLDMEADVFPGGELNIALTATIAPSFTGILPNTASLVPEVDSTDPTPDDHESSTETLVIAVSDVQVDKSNGVETVVAGTDITYVITVSNPGPSDAPEVRVVDVLPFQLSNANWSCTPSGGATCPAGDSGNIDFTGALPAGGIMEIVLVARLSAGATGTLSNTAAVEVLGDAEDPDLDDNQSTDTDVIDVQPDLSLNLIAPLNPFDSGGDFDLPIVAVVRNLGPSDSSGGELVLDVDQAVTQSFDPSCSFDGPNRLRCPVPALPVDQSVTLRVDFGNLPLPPSSLTVEGEVFALDNDPDLSNNVDSVTNMFETGGDVLVYIENGLTSLIPGRAVGYQVLLINIGSLPVDNVDFEVPVADGLLNATWSCVDVPGNLCSGSGSGGIVASFDMARSARAEYLLQGIIDPSIDPQVQPTIAQWGQAIVPDGSDINLDNNEWVDEDPLVDIIFADGFETLEPTSALLQKADANPAGRVMPIDFQSGWFGRSRRDSSSGEQP